MNTQQEAGPSVAWYEAVKAIGRMANVQPLPKEVLTVENDDWKLTINLTGCAHNMGDHDLGRFEILTEGKKYLSFGILSPSGGMIGGMSEDQFIGEMQRLAP